MKNMYTSALRKKMVELEKKELLKQQEKLTSKKKKTEKSLAASSSSTKVTDEDLTSGLLNITNSKAWSTVPVVNYGSSSEED